MKTEQKIIEHAEAMQQAYEAGKKLAFSWPENCENQYRIKDFKHLLRALGSGGLVTIARRLKPKPKPKPELKEQWQVWSDGIQELSFPDELQAKSYVEARSASPIKRTVRHMREVML